MAVSRYNAPSHPINQFVDTALLSTYAAATEIRMLATTTP
jgi:hypothetical protein